MDYIDDVASKAGSSGAFENVEQQGDDLVSANSQKEDENVAVQGNKSIIKNQETCLLYTSPSPRDS